MNSHLLIHRLVKDQVSDYRGSLPRPCAAPSDLPTRNINEAAGGANAAEGLRKGRHRQSLIQALPSLNHRSSTTAAQPPQFNHRSSTTASLKNQRRLLPAWHFSEIDGSFDHNREIDGSFERHREIDGSLERQNRLSRKQNAPRSTQNSQQLPILPSRLRKTPNNFRFSRSSSAISRNRPLDIPATLNPTPSIIRIRINDQSLSHHETRRSCDSSSAACEAACADPNGRPLFSS